MLNNYRSLGSYCVKDKTFLNKSTALVYSKFTKEPIYWNFCDDVFTAIDWTVPIETDLKILYRRRALQLREAYDYISLFYSGGVDSTNILQTFIENGIHLDEVVMHLPKVLDGQATSVNLDSANINSEIIFSALPYLRNYLKTTKTKVRLLDFVPLTRNLLSDDKILSQYINLAENLSISTISAFSMLLLDSEWDKLYDAGINVCHLHGVDKPFVSYSYNTGYSFRFKDFTVWKLSAEFETSKSIARTKHQFQELFYWSGDLPELVIKQCQLVKAAAETNKFFRYSLSHKLTGYEDYKAVNPIIYDAQTMSVRNLFTTKKLAWGDTNIMKAPWDWINKTLDVQHLDKLNNIISGNRPDPSIMLSKTYTL